MDILLGLLTPVFVYILVLLLYWVLPARRVTGYVNDPNTGQPYQYRLNGVLVLLSIVSVWTLVCHLSLMPWDWFYQIRWWSLAGAGAVGLAYTSVLVMQVPHNDTSIWADLIYGRIENRQYANKVDVKMHLYLSAVVMLCLNVLSFAAHHSLTFGGIVNPGVFLYALLFIFMLFDCVIFERAHLYTYDLSKARLGLKLVLGCLVFYPYFLVAGLWATAELAAPSIHNDGLWLALAASVFFCGWVLARGANLQKYYFKRFPPDVFYFGSLNRSAMVDRSYSAMVFGAYRGILIIWALC